MNITEQLEDVIDQMRCYNCKKPTDRFIVFNTTKGVIQEFECIDCRQQRVQKQVDEGRRPASDLLPENLPEERNPL